MYKTKKDVDKHVESLISKMSVKEFKNRAFSLARLYYDVGDYASCQRYVEQYLTQKDNNAAAHRLLGQALQKLAQKEKALEQFKTSLDIDPTQTGTILIICELLADDEVSIDSGRAKYWCEKAEATFPRHPVTFRLRERLVTLANPDPEALANLLTTELAVRPKDAQLHIRLLKHYMHTNQLREAFDHCCNVEFSGKTFIDNYAWYDALAEIFRNNLCNTGDWLYQLLLLTVRERLCVLSLSETPSGSSKSLIESNELLHAYDQAIESVAVAGAPAGFGEFHASLLQHHRGQFVFHSATFLLKKAKKDQLSWRDATGFAAPLMLIAWQIVPLDFKVNWLTNAPEKLKIAARRWYSEGTFRCSQSGHYLLSNMQDKNQSFLDRISQCCSGTHWRDKLYEKIFTTRDHLAKIKSSHFVSNAYNNPVLRLPRRTEVEAYDGDAQKEYANSLHHFIWMLLNYKEYAHFKCTIFDMLTPTVTNCGPETLNKLDVHAFLYCSALTTRQLKSKDNYMSSDKPKILPANITDLLCPLSQMKWWDCAYKFSQNELGMELTDIRATLSRGIEVVRCIDNHGLDPELLFIVGKIFSERAKLATAIDEKNDLEIRAALYYSSAIPLLEKLKSKITVKMPVKRLFDYTHKEISLKELNALLEESKLYVSVNFINDCEYQKAIDILLSLKSPLAFYHLSQIYKKIAVEESNSSRDNISSKSKYASMLSKAKDFAYKALNRMKDTQMNKDHPMYSDIQQLIEEIETSLNRIDPDLSDDVNNDVDGRYSSDENVSSVRGDPLSMRNNYHIFTNLSSTPKQPLHTNVTNYRTAIDTNMFETARADTQLLERMENQIKDFQKRLADDFMGQTKHWFDENHKFNNQLMNTIKSDIQNTTDQVKLLKISVDHVKDQIDDCRNECKDVGDLKKQIADLKKEVNKLKKASSEQTIDENELYNLDDDYRTNDSASTFATQLPFQAPPVLPPFNQRIVPPFPIPSNPYQLYNQNLYNMYNQYSQFAQTPAVPGATPLFDPTRTPNYTGVYQTPDQMYLDVAHLVPPTVPAAPTIPTVPAVPTLPTVPAVSVPPQAPSAAISKPARKVEARENLRSLPVNVVITSSDPLPTCTTAPAPILSVTIPPKHIKGTPHNYQIAMPSVSENKVMSPPVFSFPEPGIKMSASNSWMQSTVFKSTQPTNSSIDSSLLYSSIISNTSNNSKSDGSFLDSSQTTYKTRTLSERSNASVENYDPCPDFKPIIPLPAEVQVTTGEEDETAIFSARAKLFRFIDKQWKERGIGEMKLLKHKITGKVRVLMRREQIHKICANHIITPDMEIKPMQNETKAYFWVANDFADEIVVLEKFCIRFKTADTAHAFYDTFEKARLESKVSNAPATSAPKTEVTVNVNSPNQMTTLKGVSNVSHQDKTQIGGFTFSSKPTFKTVPENSSADISAVPASSKVNVFSTLTFKSTTTSPFSNIFSTTASSINDIKSQTLKQESPIKLNSSDAVDEFEPTVEFKPVVPLPALVDQKTGEEDEIALFEHRAKLLRFDATGKEWKERGLGNIKLLVHKENNQKLRLLMRREQIMKVCCNHAVTKEMLFQKMPNMDKAVTWCAKDFSDGELVAETFCLRFKTVQACDDFIEALKMAQSKIKDESKAAKEEQNAAKQNNPTGFGDMFKPKPGSWQCDACYTNNLESFAVCGCCEQPKPQTDVNESNTEPTCYWGDKFKPKPGSWECKECLIRNECNVDYCSACNSPKESATAKKETKLNFDNAPKFNFGIPTAATTNVQNKDITPTSVIVASPWGDKFKPKDGTWECKQCFVRNESNMDTCSACTSPKDSNVKDNETTSTLVGVTSGPKFSFGIPSNTNDQRPKIDTTSIFDGTGGHKFSFGIPINAQDKVPNVISFGNEPVYGTLNLSTTNGAPINLSSKIPGKESIPATPIKPALLPTPQKTDSTPFGSKEGGTFDFVFKPKTPPKGKSPVKSPRSQKGDDSDGNEYVSEDEGHHIHFSPVIPMPDKVDVVTGEENETEVYAHRAKLYRFISGEWKERGIGIVKILKHNKTNKLRVVMRREQVLKICLNHVLTNDIIYTTKDDKTWLFAANDFSEGELSLQQFCLRFKTKDIARDFYAAVEYARNGKPVTINDTESKSKNNDSDEVVFVSEIHATTEDQRKAKELMLPENFFNYKNKQPCKGCRGCEYYDENESTFTITSKTMKVPPSISTMLSTPVRSQNSSFQSVANSFYATPANFNVTLESPVFRTPLGSIGSNTDTVSPVTPNSTLCANSATDKENTLFPRSIFSGLGEQSTQFTTPQSKPANAFGAGDINSAASSRSALLAAPKLNTVNSSADQKQSSEPKSIFGNTNAGVSANKSIFCNESQKGEVKSIFGAEDSQPVNLFSGATHGSIFGPGAMTNNRQQSGNGMFGAAKPALGYMVTPDSQSFGNGKSIFQNVSNETVTWNLSPGDQNKPDVTPTNILSDKNNDEAKIETPFSVDNSLSFAALSTSGTDFRTQKKPDFQWEGAGQQLFGAALRAANKEASDKSKNDSGAGDDSGAAGADEEYDPHYEPIVPLPEKIVVTTGEEDEKKVFGERCKLYRYDDKSREWKERGVGEMKILYHPQRATYRLLLRREQVHKAVLNMLLTMDLELLPMKNSDRAWTWAGRNHAENLSGDQETLAVRFKSVDLATNFRNKVVECVRKLQAAAAQAVKNEQEKAKLIPDVAPLRLPKHLQSSVRADVTPAGLAEYAQASAAPAEAGETMSNPALVEVFKQVHFQDPEKAEEHHGEDDDDENYDHDYEDNEDYDNYYNVEEEAAYTGEGVAIVQQGAEHTTCEHAQVLVLFDNDTCAPKILVTDADTGEILADMLVYSDTEFQMDGESCSWSGTDYTSNNPVDKAVTIHFHDSDSAMQFYDSCETSKAATYSSTDPE